MKDIKKNTKDIESILAESEMGELTDLESAYEDEFESVYKITTTINKYYVTVIRSKSSKEKKYYTSKNKRLNISQILHENGVPTIQPIKFDYNVKYRIGSNNYIFYLDKGYSEIEPFDLNSKKIKKLSKVLAILHNLNIKNDLPVEMEPIKLNLKQYIKRIKKVSDKLYKLIYDNYLYIEEIKESLNSKIEEINSNLCISIKNYNLSNVLWDEEYMYLLDNNHYYMCNPTVSLVTSAFNFSKQESIVNKTFYKDFISTYIKKYGPIQDNFETCLEMVPYQYIKAIEEALKNLKGNEKETIEIITNALRDLNLYDKNKEEFYNIYLKIVKK